MSLLDKIRREQLSPSVKVEGRSDPLKSEDEDEPERSQVTAPQAPAQTIQDQVMALEKELEQYPKVSDQKVGVRLEEPLLAEIKQLCAQERITVETLLEGLFTVASDRPTVLKQAIKEAQSRVKRRTEAGNLRSLITKTRNLSRK